MTASEGGEARAPAHDAGGGGRRGGRGRRKELEATFDHGETDGYGLWLDPSVKDNPVYAEHWAGQREVTVRIDADQIVIRRAGAPEPAGSRQQRRGRSFPRPSRGQQAATGEVAGAAQVEPEGRVGERLRVGLAARGRRRAPPAGTSRSRCA